MTSITERKPEWLRVRLAAGPRVADLQSRFKRLGLHTVCDEARCPNKGECWDAGTATVMVLGDVCTRGCRFCAVTSGHPRGQCDPNEPEHVARALAAMELGYVVITMVDRDDLPDGGASHVARTIDRAHVLSPALRVEALVGDFGGRHDHIVTLVRDGRPDVFAHNVEVVPRLQAAMRDARCSWQRSIDTLRAARDAGANVTKSSLMVGCGERDEEVLDALGALREADVDVVTIGQYLRPTPKHAPVVRYVEPSTFEAYRQAALAMGFAFVASGPLVRSSYRAAEAFLSEALKTNAPSHDRWGKKRRLNVIDEVIDA